MLQQIDTWLRNLSPSLHGRLKKIFRNVKKKANPKLSRQELIDILTDTLQIKPGDVLFIHSSMRNLYLDFDKSEILGILTEVVGSEGTLMFPCWQFNIRAEDYIREHEVVFDSVNTPSAMGKIPDVLRKNPRAYRSFHPTNSIVAIGKHARELTEGHENDIYPCGESSPFVKMMKYNARIIGLGVTVDNLTFVHAVEDTLKDKFPVKTRNDEVYNCKCVDAHGQVRQIKTLVASKAIANRDVYAFFEKHVSKRVYRYTKIKGMQFFSLDSVPAFEELKALALQHKSIYDF